MKRAPTCSVPGCKKRAVVISVIDKWSHHHACAEHQAVYLNPIQISVENCEHLAAAEADKAARLEYKQQQKARKP